MKHIFVVLVFLVSFCPLVQAQDSALPPCSEAEWEALANLHDDYRALIGRLSKRNDLASLVAFVQSQIQWRDALYPALPPCRESHELGILMVQTLGDKVTTLALERIAGVSTDDNPVAEALAAGIARVDAYFSSVDDDAASGSRATRDEDILCSFIDGYSDFDLNAGWRRIADTAANAEGYADFVSVAELQLAWRDHLWEQLPVCWEVFEVTYRFNQVTSDYVVGLALYQAGLTKADNPYETSIEESLDRIIQLLNAYMESNPDDGLVLEFNLPACGKDALETITLEPKAYLNLWIEMSGGLQSLEDIVAWSETMLTWRETFMPAVPRCRETIELALVKTWILGDSIPSLVADAMGFKGDDNWYERELSINETRYGDLLLAIFSPDGSDPPPPDETEALPACDAAQLDVVYGDMEKTFQSLLDNAVNIGERNGFAEYGFYKSTWRYWVWAHMPPCSEALEMALLMNVREIDVNAYLAFRFLGLEKGEVPFWEQVKRHNARFEELAAAVGREP